MDSPESIKDLAWERLEEAEILYQNGKFDGAFYLSGYSVELMLKAKICERFGIPNLFDESQGKLKEDDIKGINEVRRALKTHNLFILLIYGGLKVDFDRDKVHNTNLFKANSLLFSNWDVNYRYRPKGTMNQQDIENLLTLLSDEKGLLKWIEMN